MTIHEKKLLDTNKYLLDELATLKKNLDELTERFNKADHMDRISMAASKDKATDIYYHFWMICNDLGII